MAPAEDRRPGSGLGMCYGFQVFSDLPFEYLRHGSASDRPLLVLESKNGRRPRSGKLLYRWEELPGRRSLTEIRRSEDGFLIRIGRSHCFHLDSEARTITLPVTTRPLIRETLLWSMPAAVAMVLRGDVALHAASIDIGGRALLLPAFGGSGKSTTAAAFLQAGHRVLADDLSCCQVNGEPAVSPGPALLRLRPDTVSHLELPAAYIAREDQTKTHFALRRSVRGDGGAVPLGGIVFLRRGTAGPAFTRVPPAEALRDLWAMRVSLPEDEYRAQCFRGLATLVDRVPVWNLTRKLEWETLSAVVERIAARLHGS